MSQTFGVALIGAGVIGDRRLDMIRKTGLGKIIGIYDADSARAGEIARKFETRSFSSAEEALAASEVNCVVLATPNRFLAEYGAAALRLGKHALLEKPGALRLAEIDRLIEARNSHSNRPLCKVGYNHRFHPAARHIHDELNRASTGRIFWIRGAYGHGGRPGYEKEWRFQKELSGGGETIDQGVHLLDLVQWWLGEGLELKYSSRQNAFYLSTEDDNGFLALESKGGAHVQLHCSATQWKNLFRIEICTENVLMVWDGLGNRNYGTETLTFHHRNPAGGAPSTETLTYPDDRLFGAQTPSSWELEWRHFYDAATSGNSEVYSSLNESHWIFEVLDRIHQDTVNYVSKNHETRTK